MTRGRRGVVNGRRIVASSAAPLHGWCSTCPVRFAGPRTAQALRTHAWSTGHVVFGSVVVTMRPVPVDPPGRAAGEPYACDHGDTVKTHMLTVTDGTRRAHIVT